METINQTNKNTTVTSAEAPRHTPDYIALEALGALKTIASSKTFAGGTSVKELRGIAMDSLARIGQYPTAAAVITEAAAQRDELLAALENSTAVLMATHKQARGMWNELLAAGFADKGLQMPHHGANLAAIEKARAAIARCARAEKGQL